MSAETAASRGADCPITLWTFVLAPSFHFEAFSPSSPPHSAGVRGCCFLCSLVIASFLPPLFFELTSSTFVAVYFVLTPFRWVDPFSKDFWLKGHPPFRPRPQLRPSIWTEISPGRTVRACSFPSFVRSSSLRQIVSPPKAAIKHNNASKRHPFCFFRSWRDSSYNLGSLSEGRNKLSLYYFPLSEILLANLSLRENFKLTP